MRAQLRTILAAAAAIGLAGAGLAVPVAAQAQVKPAKPAAPAPKPTTAQAPLPAAAPAPPAAGAAPAAGDAAAAPAQPEWVARCASDGRRGTLECALEQNVFLSKTGQLIAAVSLRVPADTRQPSLAVQVPLGLFLPAGVSLQVDENKAVPLALQTCDAKGCYAATPVSPEMLGTLKAGKKLQITFQNLSKENITVPLQLANFAQAYQKIE
ncbi:Invasion protein IalB, involved in pathogenesis [Rhizobiales bacterium GAS113]|nr:Invasion protein IalB, involved in pathogenesis [Rhizobiales bacterium GAS113]